MSTEGFEPADLMFLAPIPNQPSWEIARQFRDFSHYHATLSD
jgi:hypothetical protein